MTTRNAAPPLFLSLVTAAFLLTVTVAISSAQTEPTSKPTAPAAQTSSDETFIIKTSPCKARRDGRFTGVGSLLGELFSGPSVDKLVHKGKLVLDDRTHTFYLPKAKAYSVKNTGKPDDLLGNTSTLVSIDANGDGKLADEEGWYASGPIRLDDAMFEITTIADDGGQIELKRSDVALRGLIVGRKCPPFSFKTTAGRKVNLDSYRGKALLLNVWSVT